MTGDEDAARRAVLDAINDDAGWISGPCGPVDDNWVCRVGTTVTDCWWHFAPVLTSQRCASAAVCAEMVAKGRELAAADDDDEPCYHEHDEECYGYDGHSDRCTHQHCFACGGCQCPGYCDDHQTYNLRPAETGGDIDEREG